jgi:predicted nucleic-acid-binding protein
VIREAAARKKRQGRGFADALHHALAAGCDDFVAFDTTFARRAVLVGLNPSLDEATKTLDGEKIGESDSRHIAHL